MSETLQATEELSWPERQALEWLELIIMGELSPNAARALMRWRAQSPANEAAFRRAATLKYLLDQAAKGLAGQSILDRISYEIPRIRAAWSRHSRGSLC